MITDSSPAPLITLESVSFGYGNKLILKNLSLEIYRGDFIGLIGPNGAGKSTLFKGLLGLIPTLKGKVAYKHPVMARVGYVPQRDQLDDIYPLTVRDVVEMGLVGVLPWYRRLDTTHHHRIQNALEKVGLNSLAHHSFAELSGGQRQRTLIARALSIDPTLLVLDEPTAGIDPDAEEKILTLLHALNREQQLTILMVSHHHASLHEKANRLIRVENHTLHMESHKVSK